MAVDEALFLSYPQRKIPVLRIYGWQPAFISLGCNQKAEEIISSGDSTPFVRRMTGGSAILHDKEITYSLSCAASDLELPRPVKDSYRKICSFLINFYSRLNLKADFAEDLPNFSGRAYGKFCFDSCQGYDLVINGRKSGGNAQKRRRNLIFQHGSIPEMIGFSQAALLLIESFEFSFGVKLKEEKLSLQEGALAKILEKEKYAKTRLVK